MFTLYISVLLIVDWGQLIHRLLQRNQQIFKLSLLTKDEVEFLSETRLVYFDTFNVGIQLGDLEKQQTQ
jgi:hypothetical protein